MSESPPYKKTLFDREGPDAAIKLKAYFYAAIAGGVSIPMFLLFGQFFGLSSLGGIVVAVVGPVVMAVGVARISIRAMDNVQDGVNKILTGGASTPYTEQNSYQQALVMQGRLDEALASYEALIAEPECPVDT